MFKRQKIYFSGKSTALQSVAAIMWGQQHETDAHRKSLKMGIIWRKLEFSLVGVASWKLLQMPELRVPT